MTFRQVRLSNSARAGRSRHFRARIPLFQRVAAPFGRLATASHRDKGPAARWIGGARARIRMLSSPCGAIPGDSRTSASGSRTASRPRVWRRAGQAYDAGPAADENSPPARFPRPGRGAGSARNNREDMLLQ